MVMNEFNRWAKKPFKEQAIIFLTVYWESDHMEAKAEHIWEFYHGFKALDNQPKACELDEFMAHKFLENLGQAMTALELRAALKEIDINQDHKMCLLEYLMFKYEKKVEDFVERRNKILEEEKKEAEAESQDPDMAKALAALDAVQTEIDRIEHLKHELEEKSLLGGVKGNAAKQQLFELMNNDPTELNAALLSAEAAVRKVTKNKPPTAGTNGQVWFMNRELEEAKKYQPKGGKKKSPTASPTSKKLPIQIHIPMHKPSH
jgi:hypothetical protein